MGVAYTAQADDAYAPVYNPGGLGFLPSTQIAGQHLSYLETLHYEFLSAVHPLKGGGALGFAAQYLGSGDITQPMTWATCWEVRQPLRRLQSVVWTDATPASCRWA